MVTRTVFRSRIKAENRKLLTVPKTQYISYEFIFYSVIGLLQVLSENEGVVENWLDSGGGFQWGLAD